MAPELQSNQFRDYLSIIKTGEDEYESEIFPARMGNVLPIAYGGCALGLATRAACATVRPSHKLYSFQGNFLGPTSTAHKLICKVHRTRETKTFATRRVEASQLIPGRDGKLVRRLCVEVIVDFHIEETPMFVYSAKPSRQYSLPEECATMEELREQFAKEGKISAALNKLLGTGMFSALSLAYEVRHCPEGMGGQNLWGLAKDLETTQDGLHMTDKSSAEWIRLLQPVKGNDEQLAATAFLLDGALAFLPLSFSHTWFEDASASSSLDFSLRVFVPQINLEGWHLSERRTVASAGAKHLSESRLWDDKGTLVAVMSQTCILRPRKGAGKVLKSEL
jgi:acyl-CoA thioesterase II